MENTLFEDLKFAKLPNKEVYAYRDLGNPSSQVLLLLHGNFTTSLFFEHFALQVSKHYRVIAPDMRGFGHSTYITPITSLDDLCEDLKYLMETLQISHFNLLGWSAGGAIAQLFACKYSNLVDKLVLIGSVGPKGPILKNSHGLLMKEKEDFDKCWNMMGILRLFTVGNKKWIRSFVELGAFQNKDLPPEDRLNKYVDEITLQKNIVDLFYALNRFNISSEDNRICQGTGQIKDIKAPCLLIHGNRDQNVDCMTSWEIKKCLVSRADVEIIKEGGHFLLEPNTVKPIVESVEKFLARTEC